jgi:hypothetical protein
VTLLALSDPALITFSVAGVVVALGLLALLRIIFRKEPSPPTWRRFRVGLFVERDPHDDERDAQP